MKAGDHVCFRAHLLTATEGTRTELPVSPSCLSPPPSPIQESSGLRWPGAESQPGRYPWLPAGPNGTVGNSHFPPDC
jgi:hypothetical protein